MDVSYRRDKDHNYMVLDAPGMVTGEEYLNYYYLLSHWPMKQIKLQVLH